MLKGQTALITGGGSGIGRAIVLNLTAAGARVALLGRHRDPLEATVAEMGEGGRSAQILVCDVTDRLQVKASVDRVLEIFGALDILVCNAGQNVERRGLRSLDPADWDRLLATNLTGAFNVVHAVLPGMREQGRGLVVQIASVSAKRPSTISGPAYSASKAGQAALGVCIGREERGRGIRSSVIFPGEVNTSFLDSRSSRPGHAGRRRQGILEPGDVAAAVRFLAELPAHVHVPELVIKPVMDDFA